MKANLAVYNNGNKGDDSGTRATVRGQSQQGWDASDDVPF